MMLVNELCLTRLIGHMYLQLHTPVHIDPEPNTARWRGHFAMIRTDVLRYTIRGLHCNGITFVGLNDVSIVRTASNILGILCTAPVTKPKTYGKLPVRCILGGIIDQQRRKEINVGSPGHARCHMLLQLRLSS